MKVNFEKILAWFTCGMIVVMLTIIGFFAKETFSTIKSLEKDIVSIRLKLADLEAKRISREEVKSIIKEYHDSHPCTRKY